MKITTLTIDTAWPHIRAVLLTDGGWIDVNDGTFTTDPLTGEVTFGAGDTAIVTTIAAITAVRVDRDMGTQLVEATSARREAERRG